MDVKTIVIINDNKRFEEEIKKAHKCPQINKNMIK